MSTVKSASNVVFATRLCLLYKNSSVANAFLFMVESSPCYTEAGQSPPYDQLSSAALSETAIIGVPSAARPGLLSPWLGLHARLLLSPISVALISLIFVGMRLVLSSSDISDSVATAKSRLLASCSEAEAAVSLAVSLPHFIAASTNTGISRSITASVRGAGRVTLLGITAIERILSYFVDSYRSLFLCFMELLVRGSLAVVIAAVQLISDAVQTATQTIRAAIQESISGVNSVLAGAVAGVNEVIGVFGQSVTAPSISVPSLNALENIKLPTVIQDSLVSLNSSLPTLAELKQKMDSLIQTPFETMKVEVNDTTATFSFNDSLLSVPSMRTVAFCDKVDTSPLDHLEIELHKMTRVGIAMLFLLAIGLMLLCAGTEWYSFKSSLQHLKNTRTAYLISRHSPLDRHKENFAPRKTHADSKQTCHSAPFEDILEPDNLKTLLEVSKHPLLSTFAVKMCRKFGIRSTPAKARVSWFLCFVSFPAAVACLLAGVVGLISVYGQIFAINNLSSHYENELASSLQDLSSSVTNLVNSQMQNASSEFATSTNAVIVSIEDDLNTHLFGWVNTTTTTMNNTLNEILDGITGTLSTTFGNTPLEAPLQAFVDCIIGQKIKGIEQALTWIHDNADVNFSRVPNDVLMISTDQQAHLMQSVSDGLLGSSSNDRPGIVRSIVSNYIEHLRKELVMFWALLVVYAAVVFIGILVVIFATVYDRRVNNRASQPEDPCEPTDKTPAWSALHSKRDTYEQVSPFVMPSCLKPLVLSQRVPLTRSAVLKANISYPVHSIPCSDKVMPVVHSPNVEAPCRDETNRRSRSSWLSFLIKAGSFTDTASKNFSIDTKEDANPRFERLFGCSPVASPVSTRFPLPTSVDTQCHAYVPFSPQEIPLIRAKSMCDPSAQLAPPRPCPRNSHPHSYLRPHRLSHQHVESPTSFVFHAW